MDAIRPDLRAEIGQLLDAGESLRARARMLELWETVPSPATAAFLLSCRAKLPGEGSQPFRLAILRSATVEPLVPLLRAAALVRGIDLTVSVGAFNAYSQEILDPVSPLYAFSPDMVVLATESRDVAPDLWRDFTEMSADAVDQAVRRTVDTLEMCAREFRSRSRASLVMHTLELPEPPHSGIFDAQMNGGQARAFRQVNDSLLQIAQRYAAVFLLDYDALLSRHGKGRWHDERKWLTSRMPVSAVHMVDLASEWCRYVVPLAGRGCKALAVDLDNTLWGGTVGEDGPAGISLGAEYPGAAFQSVQRALRDLYNRGIILAVCSKNNPADALEVIRSHPGMLLRPEHFAALRINWQDKVQNLQEIAAELNIGIDSIAFLDDNPAERQAVRMRLPQVTVIDLPADPMGYVEALQRSPIFERLSFSQEDRERGRYYAEQRLRTELEQSAVSLDDYYRSLQMSAEITFVATETVSRAAQLTQKTNQFNLTTRRYSEQQIAQFRSSPDWRVYLVRLRDRFGDNGIVGLAIVHNTKDRCEIDSFLLSCRVIGRTVETALMATIVEHARELGVERLSGHFIPTKKNGPASAFYESHGFVCVRAADDGSHWELDLATADLVAPSWIERQVQTREVAQ